MEANFKASMGLDFKRGDIAKQKTKVGFSSGQNEKVEELFREQTIGLQTQKEFKDKRKEIEADLEKEKELRKRAQEQAELRQLEHRRKKKKEKTKSMKLSFAEDIEEDEAADEELAANTNKKFSKVGKNPNVKADFLPDRDREAEEMRERIRLKEEYAKKVEEEKQSEFTLHYVYWEGRGGDGRDVKKVPYSMKMRWGDTIGDFLNKVRDELCKKLRELLDVSGEQLFYVKEGLMIPHQHTFYDLKHTRCKVAGKEIFNFEWDPQGPDRLEHDALYDALKLTGAQHMGSVVDRRWYDKNKNMFPMSKWEVYNPRRNYDKAFIGDTGPSVVNTEHVS